MRVSSGTNSSVAKDCTLTLMARPRCAVLRIALPGRQGFEAALQHEAAELVIEAELLGERHEPVGEYHAEARVVPADQRFGAGDDALMGDQRLEVEVELPFGEAGPEVAHQLVAFGLAVHRRGIEQRDAVAAGALGLVHRDIGALQQLVGPLFLSVEDHHADARRSDMAQRAELESGPERGQHLVGRKDGASRRVRAVGAGRVQDDHELVAADARHRVARAPGTAAAARRPARGRRRRCRGPACR